MPHTKLDKRALQKKGVFDEKRFFMLLSQHCNFVDPEAVKSFYIGLVKHLTKELRENGVARLPHLGDIALVKKKDGVGWAGPRQIFIRGKYLLKFYPNSSWRAYFSKLSEKDGREGALDPHEKLLNRNV